MDAELQRRTLLLAAALAPLAGCAGLGGGGTPTLGFRGVPASSEDRVRVADGYGVQVLAPWGEPLGIGAPPWPLWQPDASNSAAEQALQMGMHHDGLHFYALGGSDRHGLLVINHEYTDDGLLHVGGMAGWSAAKVAKAQAAVGISVIEIELAAGRWQLVRPSRWARRITATTPLLLTGPAAGHALLKTAADPGGRRVLGTLANCGAGRTPWGTFLSGEENFADYFATADVPTAHERRWGLGQGSWYRWHEHDARFDAVRNPNEPNRFGWIVELDPMDPQATPAKRTALGRGAHEGAWTTLTRDGRAVVYLGEDAPFECIYKFVSRERMRAGGAAANAGLLDDGTLYVARFDADGSGRWLPLVQGSGPLVPANGFADAGDVLVKTRQAGDLLGATKMDRPEWMAIDAARRVVYCALTNNAERGMPGKPGVDAANPRARNMTGSILRWQEDGDFDAERLRWSALALGGDAFACPDTLAVDARGVLWIGSDVSPKELLQGDMKPLGNNQLLACTPHNGDVRRFLVGPAGCELTGCSFTPDGRTMFVNVQHPGEPAQVVSDPAQPRRISNWPDFLPQGRPRSATLAVRRNDGGIIGA